MDSASMSSGMKSEVPSAIDSFLSDANGYEGTIRDATGQDSVTVGVGGGLVFDPPALRIDAGMIVNWESMGGRHNVVSSEDSSSDFDSSDPTDDTDTTFSQLFGNTDLQFYICEVYEGSGMLGAIEVV
ncbi:halocyanin domain-containing protein [Haloarcula halophila]|uniref:halocyanin domain-containing protein n=2 Tax=Haloarcula TaxID=2237 RepID=UPI0023E3BDF0|nr:halocyanin domain-containing protein [Halomicroarcula sp. DFY41]